MRTAAATALSRARDHRSPEDTRTQEAAYRSRRRQSAAGTRRPQVRERIAADSCGDSDAARPRSLRVAALPFRGDARHPRRMRLQQHVAKFGIRRQCRMTGQVVEQLAVARLELREIE